MKILYLTKGDHVDYQNDCLLIGLKEHFGADVVDINKQLHNYDNFDAEKAKTLYGRGMTVTRVLPNLEVDRTDLTAKIKNKFFDLIVYGSIWRCSDHLDKILEHYSSTKVVAVDGEDETNIHPCIDKKIIYFKRELIYDRWNLHPISFAMPTTKCVDKFEHRDRTKPYAYITPLDRSTYIYNNETDYYEDYKNSYFAVTLKKAGWDCMRHYEILGNGCLPLFPNIRQCPKQTMVHFPKQECIEIENSLQDESPAIVHERYAEIFEQFMQEHGTTKALATDFINTCNATI